MADTLASTFNFRLTLNRTGGGAITPLGDGAFQECTGLDVEMDVLELVEGGRNDGVIRRVGRGKYTNIALKRGMLFPSTGTVESPASGTVKSELWAWIQDVLRGVRPVRRYDGVIEILDGGGQAGGRVVATWVFDRGLPAKVTGPQLNAKTGEIAIEELTIAHEGLRLRI
jgi:phage tail-like protein